MSRASPRKKMPIAEEQREVLFMVGYTTVYRIPFDQYEPGDITEIRERIAERLSCGPHDVEVRITGI